MIKKVLKWAAVVVICFFGIIVAVAVFDPHAEPSPVVIVDSPSTPDTVVVQATTPVETLAVNKVVAQPTSSPTTNKTPVQTNPQSAPSNSQYTYYSVTKVVDGDTITINLNGTNETIRLIGINTPETVDPQTPVQCYGPEASSEAKTLLSGQKVRIEEDPTQGERDKYGRLLAYVYRSDGLFFNDYMIQQGYAYEYTYNKPYKYQTQFKADQATAKSQNKGLWSSSTCNGSLSTGTSNSTTASTPTPTATSPGGHTFYLSTYYTAKVYYCDTDETWKSLSPNYLKSYTSEQALLSAYPNRTLHEACK